MNSIQSLKCPSPPSSIPAQTGPETSVAATPTPKAPAAYSLGALFKKLENGRYAATGRTGDSWDIVQAPAWRSDSKLLDPLLIQAGNVMGSLAFAANVIHNAGAKVFHDIPHMLMEAPEHLDRQSKKHLGMSAEEIGLLARSATPTFPLDDLLVTGWIQAKGLSNGTKLRIFGPELKILARDREHILKRHAWVDLRLSRSFFFPGTDIDALVEKARRLPRKLQNNGKYVRVAEAKEYVGLDKMTGRPTKIYTVVTDALDKNVITEHPGLPEPKYGLGLQ